MDYDVVECDWFTDFSLIGDFFSGGAFLFGGT
jgi:hypothetical protein